MPIDEQACDSCLFALYRLYVLRGRQQSYRPSNGLRIGYNRFCHSCRSDFTAVPERSQNPNRGCAADNR